MWENETVVLVTSLKKRMLEGKKQVRYKKICEDDAVPLFVRTLFDNRVEALIKDETPFILKSTSHFRLENEDLNQFNSRIKSILIDSVTFPENEVEEILRQALIIRLDYIVKPIATMRKMLFPNGRYVRVSEIEDRLQAFLKVLPYAGLLVDVCKRDEKDVLQPDDYGNISNRLLQMALGEDPVKVLLRDFSVLVEYLSETKGEEIHRVEGSLIQEFLADRDLWGYRRAMDVEMKLGKEDFEAAELELTLRRYQSLKAEFCKGTAEPAPVIEESKEPDEKVENGSEELKLSSDEEWALNEMLGAGSVSDEIIKEPVPAEKEHELAAPEPVKQVTEFETPEKSEVFESQPLGVIREEATEESETNPLEPPELPVVEKELFSIKENRANLQVSGFIDSKTEKLFVKKLFGGDQEAYNSLLGKLDQAESWRVAKILIDNELFKRDVDPFSREAIKLVDLVYSCYYPEEGVGGKQ